MLYENPLLKFKDSICSGEIAWRSPSNIALVKYWGKKQGQIPQNPSLSFCLSKSYTQTEVDFFPSGKNGLQIDFFLDGALQSAFGEKTKKYFESLRDVFPFVAQLHFVIHSTNTFPHSAGIASSASGISALALALCTIESQYFDTLQSDEAFYQKASFLARLGSGSACRSLYGGLVEWGATDELQGSSDLYGLPLLTKNIHPVFLDYQDTILLVDASRKKISSSVGHGLMKGHPFAKARFQQARTHMAELLKVLKSGDLDAFIDIVESEAFSLHAMMMTSNPYYLLMKANSLQIIEKVFVFRKSQHVPLGFTMDAGPNVHLLYPKEFKSEVTDFIKMELSQFVGKNGFIEDEVGEGPEQIV